MVIGPVDTLGVMDDEKGRMLADATCYQVNKHILKQGFNKHKNILSAPVHWDGDFNWALTKMIR